MNTPAAAVILAAVATASPAQLSLIDLLPGYTLGQFHGMSADGSTLMVDMFVRDSIAYDAYGWRNDAWESLPRHNQFNHWQGISADGRTTLSESSRWGGDSRLVLVSGGVRTDIGYTPDSDRRTLGALTRDGSTVFYSQHGGVFGGDPDAARPVELFRYQAGNPTSQPIATLPDRYTMSNGLIAGDRNDFFVINAQQRSNGIGRAQALIYDAGQLTELPTLPNADIGSFRAIDMTADGSVIVGAQDTLNGGPTKSWIYRDATLSELTIDGFDRFSVRGISDDASAMIGYAVDDAGLGASYLFYDDGRSITADALLAEHGVGLVTDESASFESISADGLTVAGAIFRNNFTPFGPKWTLFTITVPTPASLLPLAGLLALARRRR